MIQDTSETITRSAKRFFSGTFISRLTGLAREIAMATAFGTLPAVAAFWMAFRFAHLLRRIFGEGALNAAFIPHFERLRGENPLKGARFFYDLTLGITFFLVLLTLFIEGILGGCLFFLESKEVIRLTMILLPGLLFISLYALNSSLLNCERSYFIPSVAPALINLVWIIALPFLWRKPPSQALEKLAMILVFAFALQWVVTLPSVLRYLSQLTKEAWPPFSGREILKIMRPFALALIGVTAAQINSAFDAIFARLADPEGPAYLWYAIRIQQLPLALFGVGLMGALLPPISRALDRNNVEQYHHFVNFALRKAVLLMVPLTVGVLTLGFSGINLVYGHGAFSSEATLQTTLCLFAYGMGLLPMTAVLVLASAFYAQKNYRIPTLISLFTVGLNIGLNALFVFFFQMGAVSIALATTLTAALNAFLLAFLLKPQGRVPCVKIVLCSLIAASLTLLVGHMFFHDNTLNLLFGLPLFTFSRTLFEQLLGFSVQSLLFGTTLFVGAYLMGLEIIPLRKRVRA